jgi:isocitrate dehydrogenase
MLLFSLFIELVSKYKSADCVEKSLNQALKPNEGKVSIVSKKNIKLFFIE